MEPQRTKISRDSTFARATADIALVMNLGRDIEISFLQEGPEAVSRTDGGEEETTFGFEMEPTISEVCRVRLSPATGVVLALSILNELAPTGRLNVGRLREAFDEVLSTADQAVLGGAA